MSVLQEIKWKQYNQVYNQNFQQSTSVGVIEKKKYLTGNALSIYREWPYSLFPL